MTTVGVFIIIIALLIFILTLVSKMFREHIKLILPITIAFGFLGYGLIIYERVIEFHYQEAFLLKLLYSKW
jgi:drug/metabolite transporter (DMT)-like permease